MTLTLTEHDRQMLDGVHGPGTQMAMRIMVRMADALDAEELMDITAAHIDGCGLLSDAGLEFAETLAAKGAKTCVPTTLNMGPLDLQNWKKFDIDPDFAQKATRQGAAYENMGCVPTWTCAPYQTYLTPRFGQQIAWGESNAVCYANSVIGARTNRYGDYIDICAAITGRVPKTGLHLTENRAGQVLIRLKDIPVEVMAAESFYPAFGHLVGSIAQEKIPVIEGFTGTPTTDHFKHFCAAAASAGATALFHLVGVTPEANSTDEAFHGNQPEKVVDVTMEELNTAWAELSTADEGDKLDVVILGCPHFSFAEFTELAQLIENETKNGNTRNPDVRFVIISSRTSHALVENTGILETLKEFSAEITLDTCPFHTPMIAKDTEVVMTDSGKCSYYSPGELNVKVAFGRMSDCVKSAVTGVVTRPEGVWKR